MSKQQDRPTAKIYQFPAKGRAGSAQQTAGVTSAQQMGGFTPVAYGSAWYHDAAMEQSENDFDLPQQQH